MSETNLHHFTLILDGPTDIDDELENLVLEAGCDDALLAVRDGVVYLDFDREAVSFAAALGSAISEVMNAGLVVARVEPDDLVSQAQIAERSGRTRESIRLFVTGQRGPGTFPSPAAAVTENTRLWRWSEVAVWLHANADLEAEKVEQAVRIAAFNVDLSGPKQRSPTRPEVVLYRVAPDRVRTESIRVYSSFDSVESVLEEAEA